MHSSPVNDVIISPNLAYVFIQKNSEGERIEIKRCCLCSEIIEDYV